MSGDQPGTLCREPTNMGIIIYAPISSDAGSATLSFNQPLITGRVFASTAVLIGSEFFLFIAQHLFGLESVPVLDVNNGKTVQMPLSELQEFLRWMANGSGLAQNSNPVTDRTNMVLNPNGEFTGTIGDRGFLTPESPEAPLTIAVYVIATYSNKPFTPNIGVIVPIFTFPGIRGALPLLILGLFSTIFVRAVVPPESTGSKPFSKPRAIINNPLTFTPNDLLQLLSRFGKHFESN